MKANHNMVGSPCKERGVLQHWLWLNTQATNGLVRLYQLNHRD